MYDVVIIGLGPAGSTLARLLDKKLKVACIDRKSDGKNTFKKPCGGLLSPDAQKALAAFELTLPNEVLASPQIFSVKTYDFKYDLVQNYQRFYVNIDRHKFDRWLISLIPGNVSIFQNSVCKKIEKTQDGYAVTFSDETTETTIHTRFIVGADGANSFVRKYIYPNKKIRTYTSIQQIFVDKNAKPFYSCIFDPENTDCYSWLVSKDGSIIFGGAYSKGRSREKLEKQKMKLKDIGINFGELIKTEACLVLRPSNPGDLLCGKKSAFLIGEAGGFISPSSLEGISGAINTARVLSEVLNSGSKHPNRAYRRKTLSIRLKIVLKILKCPFLYAPPLRRIVMKSGISSIK